MRNCPESVALHRDHGMRHFDTTGMRALGNRLYAELAWRSVHDRIVADRDRLRESSMTDPMLPGVFTRAALEQDRKSTRLNSSHRT